MKSVDVNWISQAAVMNYDDPTVVKQRSHKYKYSETIICRVRVYIPAATYNNNACYFVLNMSTIINYKLLTPKNFIFV